MSKSVYIHIPFCHKRCHYCSFVSFDKLHLKQQYLEVLLSEIKNSYKNELLNTIYIGGGTPSLLAIDEVASILELLNFDAQTEVTFELNPNNITPYYLKELKSLGVNRLSIGAQVFDDDILKLIGRTHSVQQIANVVHSAQDAGFSNISLDLIYGLPTQYLKTFEHSLNSAINLDVQHIALYGLKIENGCFFYKNMPKSLPDDNMQVDMYLKACALLKQKGFDHYEISNFAKSAHQSRHNLVYWNNKSYYGFGISASGYLSGVRYTNYKNFDRYTQNPLAKEETITLTPEQKLEEEIFLGFRKMEGLDIEVINQTFNIDFEKKYSKILQKFIGSDHMKKTPSGYTLTLEGVLISNSILCEFIDVV